MNPIEETHPSLKGLLITKKVDFDNEPSKQWVFTKDVQRYTIDRQKYEEELAVVRSEMHDLMNETIKKNVDEYKEKVKEAIDKIIPENIRCANSMILRGQLKKELGL